MVVNACIPDNEAALLDSKRTASIPTHTPEPTANAPSAKIARVTSLARDSAETGRRSRITALSNTGTRMATPAMIAPMNAKPVACCSTYSR